MGTHGDPYIMVDEEEEIQDEDGDEEESTKEVMGLDAENAATAREIRWWNVVLGVTLVGCDVISSWVRTVLVIRIER